MGSCIIKVSKNRDLYMKWSSVVDNCTFIGTRQELLKEREATMDAIDRADRTGTSDRIFSSDGWDGQGNLVMETSVRNHEDGLFLRREDFEKYADLLLQGNVADAEDLLVPRFVDGTDRA